MADTFDQKAIVKELKKLETKIGTNGEEHVRLRFRQGCLLQDVCNAEKSYGEGLVESVALEVGCDQKALYKWHAFARRFEYEEPRLEKEIETVRSNGKRISMAYIEKRLLKIATNPDAVGGEKNHREMLMEDAERAMQSVESAREQYPGNEEVEGVGMGVESSIADAAPILVPKTDHLPIRKEKPFRSKFFLKWETMQPCIVSGLTPCDPHHVIPKGRGGNNAGDELCIPLHRSVHDQVTEYPDRFVEICGDTEENLVRKNFQNFIVWVSENVKL